jgi:general stress protein 26
MEPTAELDLRYSAPDADPSTWGEARERLEEAPLSWLSTVRPDGRPHVTPLLLVLLGDDLFFCTGPDERKARNLADNPHCVLTTGCNSLDEGLDLVVEGEAEQIKDEDLLHRVADGYLTKYGEEWHFEVYDGAFRHEDGGRALVFRVAPRIAFAFAKGDFAQTRFTFPTHRPPSE